MAYVIGSEKGKKISEEMKTGETYEASDGSVWTKEADGSVTVRTSGNTYKNAYTPTTSNNSNATATSGSTTSNKNSQYTKNPVDDIIANAWQNTFWSDEPVKSSESSGRSGSSKAPKYSSKYDDSIDAIMNEILNRDKFSYDAASDPLYQQYAAMYQREGDRAMKETMAEAASGAGGMNSYAISAAQQAQNYYASQLNDRIPELYQLAYDMYLSDIDSKVRDLGLLQDADATQYARYRDTISDWQNDRNFAYGVYQDDYNKMIDERNFNYSKALDERNFAYNSMLDERDFNYNSEWATKEWEAKQQQNAIENSRRERDWEIEQLQNAIAAKPTLTAEQAKTAIDEGIVTDTTVNAYKYYYGENSLNDNPVVPGSMTEVLVSEWADKLNKELEEKYGTEFKAVESDEEGNYKTFPNSVEYVAARILESDELTDQQVLYLIDKFGITQDTIYNIKNDPHYN